MYPGASFNLTKLVVGAEGGLGTMTEALVHLLPLPKVRGVVVLHFDSMEHAVESVGAILSCEPSAAELLDGLILRLAEKSLEYRNYLDFVVGQPESLVLVEFNGQTRDEVQAKVDGAYRAAAWPAGSVSRAAGAGQGTVRSRVGMPQGVVAAVAWACQGVASRWRSWKTRRCRPSICRSSSRGFARSWRGTARTARSMVTRRWVACTSGRCSICACRWISIASSKFRATCASW